MAQDEPASGTRCASAGLTLHHDLAAGESPEHYAQQMSVTEETARELLAAAQAARKAKLDAVRVDTVFNQGGARALTPTSSRCRVALAWAVARSSTSIASNPSLSVPGPRRSRGPSPTRDRRASTKLVSGDGGPRHRTPPPCRAREPAPPRAATRRPAADVWPRQRTWPHQVARDSADPPVVGKQLHLPPRRW